jgi:hypothetical protein
MEFKRIEIQRVKDFHSQRRMNFACTWCIRSSSRYDLKREKWSQYLRCHNMLCGVVSGNVFSGHASALSPKDHEELVYFTVSGDNKESSKDSLLLSATSLSICIADAHGHAVPIIPRNSYVSQMSHINSFIHLFWKYWLNSLSLSLSLTHSLTHSYIISAQYPSRRVSISLQQRMLKQQQPLMYKELFFFHSTW